MLEAVESFVKSTGSRRTIFIARKVPCIHSFFGFAVEVGSDDVHLMDFPVVGSGESEEGSVKLETHHRGVSFKEVLTRDMRESSSDDTSLILDVVSVGISFDGENLSTAGGLTIGGRSFGRVSPELERLGEFDVHRVFPFRPIGT